DRLGGAIATILRENYESVLACDDMKEAIERLDSAAQFASSGREDIGRRMLAENRPRFERALAREAANITLPTEGERVADIEARYRAYVARVDEVVAAPAATRQGRYFGELLPAFTAIKQRVQAILEMNQAAMVEADRRAKALADRTVRVGLAAGALAIAFVAYLAVWLPRVVVRPLEQLRAVAERVGEGQLDVEVPEPRAAELAQLAATFRAMLAKLRAYRDSSLGELLAAKDVARATLECMIDPVVVFGADGSVQYANEAAERAFDVRAGDGDGAAARLPAPLEQARVAVLERGEPVLPRSLSEAMRWRSAEGEKDYLVRSLPLVASPGEPPRAVVVAQDVTRYRRIDELKSDLVATVSHQFKTPLTSLRMATHLLLEPSTGALTDAQRELVTTARDETERLRAMVEDLLDVVRIETEAGALHRAPVDPRALLEQVAAAHRAVAAAASVSLEVDPAADRGPFSIDAERAGIAVANLLSNAIRHSSPGGVVRLSAVRQGGQLHVSVEDRGEGIAAERVERLFERPANGAASARSGLGLTIARELALQHGGDLTVTSEVGRGSTFTLHFAEEAS
ncbi:MAG TPA: ATP-binding protein, partial [Minicystis sp.]|nr:ATP-binding protein [Minicystis sp.]